MAVGGEMEEKRRASECIKVKNKKAGETEREMQAGHLNSTLCLLRSVSVISRRH